LKIVKKYIYIYLNSSKKIGRGHFSRIINLISYVNINKKKLIILYSSLLDDHLELIVNNKIKAKKISKIKLLDYEFTNKDILILDTYFYYYNDFCNLYRKINKLIIIDDRKSIKYKCDLFLDQNLHKKLLLNDNNLSTVNDDPYKFYGPNYFIFDKKILNLKIKKRKKRNILINLGGGEKLDSIRNIILFTKNILDKIKDKNELFEIIVISRFNKVLESSLNIQSFVDSNIHIHFYSFISEITSVYKNLSFSICTFGLSFYEKAYLNIPSISFSVNSIQHYEGIVAKKMNLSFYIGSIFKFNRIKFEQCFTNLYYEDHSLKPNCIFKNHHKNFNFMIDKIQSLVDE